MTPALDPRAVQTIAESMTHAEAEAIADLMAEIGSDYAHADRLIDAGWVEARHGVNTDAGVCGLIEAVEDGTLLGGGGIFCDDHDMTADDFTRVTMADPWEYVRAAADHILSTPTTKASN